MGDSDQNQTSARKSDHLEITANESIEFRSKSTLLEQVDLLHDSLPELDVEDIDLETEAFGKTLSAPLVISGMTGGTPKADRINSSLAEIAEELGIAIGVGSQRAMLEDPDKTPTYRVRDRAPTALIFGNLGATQVRQTSPSDVESLVEAIDADALAIHLNPAQELAQPEGDRSFRGCLDAIERLKSELSCPVIAKETGCGLSPLTLDRLAEIGIDWVDVSGAGGTSWTAVESKRSPAETRDIGEMFWEWGTPTAVSIHLAAERGFRVIGSGGLRTGLDAAKALCLGAELTGMALPWLRAIHNRGHQAALDFGKTTIRALKTACLLTSSKDLRALRNTPKVLGPGLSRWINQCRNPE